MTEEARNFSTKQRKRLAKKGHALPDGSFPIVNESDLKNAIQAYGRASNKTKAKRHIIKRARALGATSLLPDDWKKSDKSNEDTIMSRIECTYEDCGRTFIDKAMMEDHSEIVHTLSDLRRAASQAVREAHGKRSYLMDMGPDWVVFEAELEEDDDRSYGLFKTSFTHSDGKISLGESMTEVERKTAYVPVAKQESASLAMASIGIILSDALVVTDSALARGGKTAINGTPPSDTPHEFAQEGPMADPKNCTGCGRRRGHPIHS